MKKIISVIVAVVVVMIAVFAFWLYRQSSFYAAQQFNQLTRNKTELRKVAENDAVYQYIRDNHDHQLTGITDDQGSGKLFYFAGKYKDKYIGFEGDFYNFGIKIKKVFFNQ
ncbi:MAG: hypothetical protein M3005_05265 [Apilactobacillus sp.]|uniref:hypothetical protein n=1 Tax=Apilactobacillus sp. TaxID=2767901 RepID=UPI0025EF1850|nr:hypothetical protein [Apilactobacillus sp.]MCT6823271.1 hypothetical protein [Apilactobacillus sp.]MCT6858783.1 hypothetical protein [Apilactobacillus sp.]